MNPVIDPKSIEEKDAVLKFVLSGINVSLANALRRTIISEIPTVVFKTSPYEENKANILVNTSRLNNEILKQRLSCIPIHINDFEMPLKNLLMEVNVENLTDTIMYVTSENFIVKDLTSGKSLSEKECREIFPANDRTGYFIDFARLRPRVSDDIPGEKLHLTCEFSISSAKDDCMFNTTSTCAYGFTQDTQKVEEVLKKKRQEWKDQGLTKDQTEFEEKNWRLLDGLRVTLKDSFDFTIQTLGVFTNQELIHKACDIINKKLSDLHTALETDSVSITPSVNTMENSYDIIIENEDYTIGKILEFILYSMFYEDLGTMSFCGFKKYHPHDTDSIIRVAYKAMTDKDTVKQNLATVIEAAIRVYQKIKKLI